MAQGTIYSSSPSSEPWPVRIIDSDDLRASLADGYADFREKRGDLIFIGLLYPLIGVLAAMLFSRAQIFLLFPVFAGLSLMGPLVATGFYEIARRRELGMDASWRHFFDVVHGPSALSIVAVGTGLLAIFCAWLASAAIVYGLFFGPVPPESLGSFLSDVFLTGRGWAMIAVGNVIGFVFALIVLATSLVSLPLLVDRKVSAERAVATSLSAFRHNPGVLLRWGATVAVILVIGAIPLLIGLAVALPVLGYATWHLYTRLVDREAIARIGR